MLSPPLHGRPFLSFILALTLVLACSEDAASPEGPTEPTIDSSTDANVIEFLSLLNAHRASVGCSELIWRDDVAQVAQAHSEDMVARNFFSHDNPDGKDPFERLRDAGVDWNGNAGENISSVGTDAQEVLNSWLSSNGHRQNIEECRYTHHGVGLAEGKWTHVFVRITN